MRFELATLVVWTMLNLATGKRGYELNAYQETPGVYFEDLGRHSVNYNMHHSSVRPHTNNR
jgi:hypothetical protein